MTDARDTARAQQIARDTKPSEMADAIAQALAEVRAETAADRDSACPCRRAQTHADTSVWGPCRDRACRCYYLGDGTDACLWSGHGAHPAPERREEQG